MTPEEASQIIRKCAKEGRIEFANPNALARINMANPDFTVVEATLLFVGEQKVLVLVKCQYGLRRMERFGVMTRVWGESF